jgi:RND family efflux transporter MFP subunit
MQSTGPSFPARARSGCCRAALWGAVALLYGACSATAFAQSGGVMADTSKCLIKPRQLVQLGSPVFGVLADVFVDRAQAVTKGQLLAKLDTTVEEAQLEMDRYRSTLRMPIDSAKVDMVLNQRELARRQQLANNMFSRANDVDEYAAKVEQDRITIQKAEADLETARLEAQRSQAQLQLKMLRSPVDGVITEIKLSPGEFIYEQTPVLTIAQIDPLQVEVVLPPEVYASIKVGMVATLDLDMPVGKVVTAQVDAIDPLIDAASDTFRARLILPNPGNAIPAGTRCSMHLQAAAGRG